MRSPNKMLQLDLSHVNTANAVAIISAVTRGHDVGDVADN